MVAYVKMGAGKARAGNTSPSNMSIGADWGGPESIAQELTELQLQLSNLTSPCDPVEVSAVIFHQFLNAFHFGK